MYLQLENIIKFRDDKILTGGRGLIDGQRHYAYIRPVDLKGSSHAEFRSLR